MYHHPLIIESLVEEHIHDLERQADEDRAIHEVERRPLRSRLAALLRRRGTEPRGGGDPTPGTGEIRIRHAAAADGPAVRCLATRADAPAPAPPLLLLDVEGRVMAAKSLRDGALVADPRDLGLADLINLRANQLGGRP